MTRVHPKVRADILNHDALQVRSPQDFPVSARFGVIRFGVYNTDTLPAYAMQPLYIEVADTSVAQWYAGDIAYLEEVVRSLMAQDPDTDDSDNCATFQMWFFNSLEAAEGQVARQKKLDSALTSK